MIKTIIFIIFYVISISSIFSQGRDGRKDILKGDTLRQKFFLENRSENCDHAYSFMKYHIIPDNKPVKIKALEKEIKAIFRFDLTFRYEPNTRKNQDISRFYIDPVCLQNISLDSFLLFLTTPINIKKLEKMIRCLKSSDVVVFDIHLENTSGIKFFIRNQRVYKFERNQIQYTPILDTIPWSSTKQKHMDCLYPYDTLPYELYLQNRALNCKQALDFMKSVIVKDSNPENFASFNGVLETGNVKLDILYEDNFKNKKKHIRDFYYDLECLKKFPPEIVLSLFMAEKNVNEIMERILYHKNDNGYRYNLNVNHKNLYPFSLAIENGKITRIGWSIEMISGCPYLY